MNVLKFQSHIPYTEDAKEQKSYEKYCNKIKKQNFKVGDYVMFEGERCKILHMINFDECFLQHKKHQESHLLINCKKIK